MTSQKTMTASELLELAALDAFGLLDEYEAALYDKSFHEAPAHVQDEIIRIQAELASDPSLLPEVDAPESLRRRVLEALSRAMDQEASRLAPLASIGSRHASRGDVVARLPLGLSGQFWRAACFVLLFSVIICLYFLAQSNRHARLIAELALNRLTHEQLKEVIGPTFEEFVGSPDCIHRAFRPQSDDYEGAIVAMYHNKLSNEAFLMYIGLPESDEPYTLRSRDDDGRIQELATIDSNGGGGGLLLTDLARRRFASVTLEITDAFGTVVLQTG